jgi:hypothetical protein
VLPTCNRCFATLKGLRFEANTFAQMRACFANASCANFLPQELQGTRASPSCFVFVNFMDRMKMMWLFHDDMQEPFPTIGQVITANH